MSKMQGPFTSTCPLCGSPCQLFKADYEQWHHFRCACCREIKINARFVDDVRATSAEERAVLAARALDVSETKLLTVARDPENPGAWTWTIKITDRQVI